MKNREPRNWTSNLFNKNPKIKFSNKLKIYLLKIEIGCIATASLSIFYDNLFVISSIIFLGIIYFLMLFAEFEHNKKISKLISDLIIFLVYFGRAACLAGLSQYYLDVGSTNIMIFVGPVFLLISLPLYLYFLISGIKDEVISLKEFLRNFVIISLTIYYKLIIM